MCAILDKSSEASTRRPAKRMMGKTGGVQFSYWNVTNAAGG
jgi:hypothetical protein